MKNIKSLHFAGLNRKYKSSNTVFNVKKQTNSSLHFSLLQMCHSDIRVTINHDNNCTAAVFVISVNEQMCADRPVASAPSAVIDCLMEKVAWRQPAPPGSRLILLLTGSVCSLSSRA